MTIEGGATLTVTGTIFVTGEIKIQNNFTRVRLDLAYGSTSGVIISDDLITLQDGTVAEGSGQPGRYLMYLSTSSLTPALIVQNAGTTADIVYTSNGEIRIQDAPNLREIIGYRLHLQNNADITYEVGLASSVFTSGPGGGWVVTSWKEIE